MFKMASKIYLEGGGRIKDRVFEKLEKRILSLVSNKVIFEIDFARYGEKLKERKIRDLNYFKELRAEEIFFSSDCDSKDIKKRINESGILYIAGGDTELLLDRIRKEGLVDLIKKFPGIIIGNSAGAYACCREYVKIRDNDVKVIPSLGLVDFCCMAHYERKFDNKLLEFSKDRDIYGIPEPSTIMIEDDKLSFIGDVYLFSKGEKIKIE